jgi:DNA adenine methylase
MKTSSPLRYPGGKSALTSLLSQIRRLNGLGNRAIAEPFAGGAGASLSLLYLEETSEIFINDADPAIHDFWWAVINRTKSFTNKLKKTRKHVRVVSSTGCTEHGRPSPTSRFLRILPKQM